MAATMTHKMTLILDPKRNAKLEDLAGRAGLSKAAIVRQLVDYASWHVLAGIPTCASGQRCLCPHAHPINIQGALPSGSITQYEMSLEPDNVCPKPPKRPKLTGTEE